MQIGLPALDCITFYTIKRLIDKAEIALDTRQPTAKSDRVQPTIANHCTVGTRMFTKNNDLQFAWPDSASIKVGNIMCQI